MSQGCSPPRPPALIPAESNFAGDIGWGHLLELPLPTGIAEEAWAQPELLQLLWLPSLCVQEGWPRLWVDSKPIHVNYLFSILLENPGNYWGRVRKGRWEATPSLAIQFSPCKLLRKINALGTRSLRPLPLGGQAGLHLHSDLLSKTGRAGEYHVFPVALHFHWCLRLLFIQHPSLYLANSALTRYFYSRQHEMFLLFSVSHVSGTL